MPICVIVYNHTKTVVCCTLADIYLITFHMSPLVLELGDLGSLWLLFPSLEPRVSALSASSLCLLKAIACKLHGRVVSKANSDSPD